MVNTPMVGSEATVSSRQLEADEQVGCDSSRGCQLEPWNPASADQR